MGDEGDRSVLVRNNSREAVVRRHQELMLAELKKEEARATAELGETKLPITDSKGRTTQQDGYTVQESSTHVTKIMTDEKESIWRTRFKQLVSGGGAGAITKTAVAPLERAKILLQIQGMMQNTEKANFKYKGTFGTMNTVVREEGFLALYKGNGANVLRVIPVYALKFAFNDTFKDMVRTPGKDLTFTQLIAAGTMAGLFQTCVTYPLETVRARLTLGSGLGVEYKGIFDVVRQTVKHEGVRGLYKGIGPTFISGSPYVGLQMTLYEVFKRNLERQQRERSAAIKQVEKLLAGACAGVIAQTLTYPGDTIRRRMQMNGMDGRPRVYTNSIDCGIKLVQKEGFTGLFNGLGANLIRCLPGAAIQFWAYDFLNALVKDI